MTELSDAIASREEHNDQQFAGLSPAERAAAETDLHMSTCDEPYIDDCGDCKRKLARIRRLVDAVRPVVEREERDRRAVELAERLRLTRLAGPEFAPYPLREEDVTAVGLARYFAVVAQQRLDRIGTPGMDPQVEGMHVLGYVREYAVVALLRAFWAVDWERADDAARSAWRALEAGEMTGEHLWEWLTEWGIDPKQLEKGTDQV
jgi:hypothetical protein